MKAKSAAIAVIPFALVGAGYWFLNRDSDALAIVRSNDPRIATVPTSKFRDKPKIDISLLGIDIQIPRRRDLPVGKVDRTTAGALVFEFKPGENWTSYDWKVGEHQWPVGFPEAFAKTVYSLVPKAFGKEPRTIELVSKRGVSSIRLPAIGKPAPHVPEQTFRVEGAVINVKPIEWVSPQMPFLCDVTLEAASASDAYVFGMGGNGGFILEKGKTCHVAVFRRPDLKALWLGGSLTPVKIGQTDVRVTTMKPIAGGKIATVNWPDGALLVQYSQDLESWSTAGPHLRDRLALIVDGISLGSDFYSHYPKTSLDAERETIFSRLGELSGKTVKATEILASGPTKPVRLDLGECPSPADYGVRFERR